jgi:nitric oxide reductase NorE protein
MSCGSVATVTDRGRRAVSSRARRAADVHVPGEVGIWVLILGDMTMFALLFGVFMHYRDQQPALFHHAQATLNQTYGAVNTVLLLTSSLCVVLGVSAVRRRMRSIAPKLFLLALACGLGFSVIKILEYTGKASHGIGLNTNDFYMYYFVLTGIHFLHLLIGMGVLMFLWRLSLRPDISTKQIGYLEAGASYWHMVDLLWIVLFPLIYLLK